MNKMSTTQMTKNRANRVCSEGLMVISPDCVLQVGVLGSPLMRVLGAVTIYVSLERPFLLRFEDQGEWKECEYAAVPPYVRHQIATLDNRIATVLIEPESVDLNRLQYFSGNDQGRAAFALLSVRVRQIYTRFRAGEALAEIIGSSLDIALFGANLARRKLDPRVQLIVDRINEQPDEECSAEDCSEEVDLSFSRFLHVFKDEMGVAFRRFKAWKRARNTLHFVNDPANLTDIAIRSGYPDSTHFSHSIRLVFGLKPKEIFAAPGLVLHMQREGYRSQA